MRERHPTADADDDRLWFGGHLTDGAIRAHLDDELGTVQRIRARRHLRRCPTCAAARDDHLLIAGRAGALLSSAVRPVDVREGWRRFRTLSAATTPAGRSRGASIRLAAVVSLAAALAAIAVVQLRRVQPVAASPHARDACCWDLDGGGRVDDGIYTRSRDGEIVDCVVVYDDIDRSGTLSDPDIIRYVSSTRACGLPRSLSLRDSVVPPALLAYDSGT
jgi:hypothetical protein